MKRFLGLSTLFLITLLVSLLVHLPASVIFGYAPLPPQLSYSQASGTIWQAQLSNVSWLQWALGDVRLSMRWSSLLKGQVEVAFRAGQNSPLNYSLKGIAGADFDGAYLKETFGSIEASEIANQLNRQLSLPLPIEAEGNVDLTLREYRYQAPWCQAADGSVAWSGANVVTPFVSLDLGQVFADVKCQDQRLSASGDAQSSQLTAEVSATVATSMRYQTEGRFMPLDEFPELLRGQLSWLGQPDGEGYYPLRYSGRL